MTTKDASLLVSGSDLAPGDRPLEALTVTELNELATTEGIDLLGVKKKADIIELVTAHRMALAEADESAGDDEAVGEAVSEPAPPAADAGQAVVQDDAAVAVAADPEAETEDVVAGIQVRTKRLDRRCRAGWVFTREPVAIALSALTAKQLEAIESDPQLHVEACEVSGLEDGE